MIFQGGPDPLPPSPPPSGWEACYMITDHQGFCLKLQVYKIRFFISEPEVDANGKPVPVVLSEDTAHLGLFLHRRAVYTCINIEGKN